jgi:hemerythrin-like domain-containing protein
MKRHEALIPLTHDHHHALVQARMLAGGAEADMPERASIAAEFVSFFENDTISHFREEEEIVFPLVIETPEAKEPLARLLLEHVHLHGLVAELRKQLRAGDPKTETMLLLSSLLQTHIRLEEKVIFPLVQIAASDGLNEVEFEPRNRGTDAESDRS